MNCRICHQPFSDEQELTQKHVFFWFACKGCVKKARTKSRWHKTRRRAVGTFSPTDWLISLLEHEFKCAQCNEKKPNLTMDHIHSLGEGGTNTYQNMQPLCVDCQSKKSKEENARQYKRKIMGLTWNLSF